MGRLFYSPHSVSKPWKHRRIAEIFCFYFLSPFTALSKAAS